MKRLMMFGMAMLACAGAVIAQPRSASAPEKLLSASSGLMAPVWSPDGKHIAVTTDNYRGILIADADGQNLRTITDADGAGYKMTWTDNNTLLGRTNINENGRIMHELCSWNLAGKRTLLAAKQRGNVVPTRRAAGLASSAPALYDQMTADPAGVTRKAEGLSQFAGDMVINPAISPDGRRIAFQVPGKGMWLINADGSGLRQLGAGSHPSWLPDNETIIYTIVQDNGEVYTASTLLALNVDKNASVTLTSRTDMIPMTPAISPDGKRVAFENAADNAIYVVTLKY